MKGLKYWKRDSDFKLVEKFRKAYTVNMLWKIGLFDKLKFWIDTGWMTQKKFRAFLESWNFNFKPYVFMDFLGLDGGKAGVPEKRCGVEKIGVLAWNGPQ